MSEAQIQAIKDGNASLIREFGNVEKASKSVIRIKKYR